MMANKSYSYFFAVAAAAAAGDAACAPLFAAVAPLTPPVGKFDNKATDNLLIIRYEMISVDIASSSRTHPAAETRL